MIGYVLDAGALIALERRQDFVLGVLDDAREKQRPLLLPAVVLGQVWRDSPRQAPINSLLKLRTLEIVPFDFETGRHVGRLLEWSGTSDVVDGHVGFLAQQMKWPVLSSDPDDLRKLYPEIMVKQV